MAESVDVAVIGGGIVGLALADAWLARNPRDSVLVLDKEQELAAHASGRNSGVLHAGFYYAPESLKARLTRAGNQQLREFCHERQICVQRFRKISLVQDDDGPRAAGARHDEVALNAARVEVLIEP